MTARAPRSHFVRCPGTNSGGTRRARAIHTSARPMAISVGRSSPESKMCMSSTAAWRGRRISLLSCSGRANMCIVAPCAKHASRSAAAAASSAGARSSGTNAEGG
eukprot:scaffold55825_cov27-Tisochrysis_lutea.AAC.7